MAIGINSFAEPAPLQLIIDRLILGVVLLDETSRVLFANEYVRRLLDDNQCLKIDDGVMNVNDSRRDPIRIWVQRATNSPEGSEKAHSFVLGEDRDLIYLNISPLFDGGGDGAANWILLVGSAQDQITVSPETVGEVFGLTPSEARVVAALAEGRSVRTIARDAALTVGTVRYYLKQAFGKTGAKSQSDLIRLVLTNPLVQFWSAKITPG